MRRYAEVLRVPHVATLVAATWLARFPTPTLVLAIIHATASLGDAANA